MNISDLYEKRQDYFLKPSATARNIVFAAIGLGAIILGLGAFQTELTRFWGALLFNVFFFFSIALGGVALGGMQDIIGATWGRPIRRIHEGFGAFLPVSGVLMILFLIAIRFDLLGGGAVYTWVKDPGIVEHFWGKNVWLQPDFMVIQDVLAIIVILVLARWQVAAGLKRDQAFIDGDRQQADAMGEDVRVAQRYWSAPILFVYAVCYSLLGFDLLMSLSPLWFSTLWGGWLFAIMMQTLMATSLIVMFWLRSTPLGSVYQRQQFHDVGKLMHGFTVFFAYLTYAHILTYWYGNVPEETEYFIHRLHGPWFYIVTIAPFFNFVIPLFALIFKAAKWTAQVTIPLSLSILVAQWFTYMLVVQPETVRSGGMFIPWVELGGLLLVWGLFMFSFIKFGQKNPMLGFGDPLLTESLAGDHH